MFFKRFKVVLSSHRTATSLRTASILIPALLLVSCAGDPARSARAGEECVYVKVTGSNLPVKECRTAEERAAIAAMEREAGEQGVRNQRDLDEFGVEAAGADSLY